MDESFLYNIFVATNQLVSVKLIRNRATGASEGYAFLEFRTHEAADMLLKSYNGQPIPGTDQVFRLNWAAYGVGKAQPAGEDCASLFVGDLAPDVSDIILQEYFRQFYPSVRSAKVITDAGTGRSKGYGFVRFSMEPERDKALTEMNGHFLSNRPIRVSLATAKKNANTTTASAVQAPHPSDFDPTNTTLFIGGLSGGVTEEQLRAAFARFGDIIYVKIPAGKGCGFVQFVLRTAAERAMTAMNGQVLGASAMRISWGRSSSRVANQAQQQAGMGGPHFPGMHAHAPFGMPGPFDPAAAAAMGAYQLGGMPGGDPYAAAAFGMQPQPDAAMFQVYQQANGAALSSLMRPNGMGPGGPPTQSGPPPQQPGAASGNPSGGATSAHVPAPAPASGSSAPQPVMNGKQAATPAAEGDGVVAVDKDGNGSYPGKPNPALLGSQLFASFMG
ncbi:polyadenylate-binding RBP47B isoform A [Micractinium conductrix]|uniref:Polyadenylate-binding RBP47B isoform A n=1 Tax=Micractinium conductrix TaxID=554055 RepID=A0A2P6VK82_9CHLO|nr:polyadenylate-binding RBP47B isoform A [Micractinium conductrix]|eukprot:PSC74511.1 polyadenylate-binding RBP47B isoform A [Micractinium conductrix]